ncbi:MAG: hypothetical protein CMH30_00995 [Micavibrio sp.]|nr:hypothetical protein [Micavibrio sp.]|tara:strand:+ start:1591 stop:2505 length:915 start_codon:yes stop_codon:yes gene_type:complete
MQNSFFTTLTESVGNRLVNREDDVRTVKKYFKNIGYLDEDDETIERGIITLPLTESIKRFQRERGLKEDGLIYPKGETHIALNIKEKEKKTNHDMQEDLTNTNFDQLIEHLKQREGGIADRSKREDPGGLTNKGISQNLLERIRKTEPSLPRKTTDLDDMQIDKIYKDEFFLKPKINKLEEIQKNGKSNSAIVEHIFDAGVTSGTKDSVVWLQMSLDKNLGTDLREENSEGVKTYDGINGSKTRQAFERALKEGKLKEVHKDFYKNRIEHFKSLPNYEFNKKGWLKRAREILEKDNIILEEGDF